MRNAILAILLFSAGVTVPDCGGAAEAGKRTDYSIGMKQAADLRKDGRYVEAESVYDRLLGKNRRDVDALLGRGLCRMKIDGRTGEALEDFRKIIVLSPGYIDAYAGAAACLRRLGNRNEARQILEEGKKAAGGDDKKIRNLANAAWSFGFWDFAREISDAYRGEVAPEEAARDEYLRTLAEARRYRLDGFPEKAEKIYRDMLAANPDDVDAIAGLGFCLLRDSKRLDEALGMFRKVIELSPEYVDAYVGAAACYSRQDRRSELDSVLEQCREACRADESRMRYLAVTAWREGHFPLARSIDREYEPFRDREKLIGNPSTARITGGYSRLVNQDDWYEAMLSFSHRPRPDITFGAAFDQWWRYGESDFNIGFGASWRYNHEWSFSYDYEFSDAGGFLAEQRHDATLRHKLYRRLYIYGGPRYARYDGDWSERGKAGFVSYWKNLFADAYYSAGRDTKNETVESFGVSAGYDYELRYALSGGYASGRETVDFIRDGELQFRSDDVESFFARLRINPAEQYGFSLLWLEEYRERSFFRRELSCALFMSF